MMIVNLQQNPDKRPISSPWVPTLLQQGLMWGIRSTSDKEEERWLLDEEHLLVMGFPILPEVSHDFEYPLLPLDGITGTQKKSLAGNAS